MPDVRCMSMSFCVIWVLGPCFAGVANATPSCEREIARQDAALRRFDADVKQASVGLVTDDVGRSALNAIKRRLSGDPTYDALEEIKEHWDNYQEYLGKLRAFQDVLTDIGRCVKKGGSPLGCYRELDQRNAGADARLQKINAAHKRFLESLGNQSANQAAERVERARGIVENMTRRAGNLAADAAEGGIRACLEDYESRVELARESPPVDLRQAPPANSPPQPPPSSPPANGGSAAAAPRGGGGMGAGTALAVVGGLAAAGGTAFVVAQQAGLMGPQCGQYETEANNKLNNEFNVAVNNLVRCLATPFAACTSQRNNVNTAISSVLGTLGNWCSCLGGADTSQIAPAYRSQLQSAFSDLRALGVNPGTLPSCFR